MAQFSGKMSVKTRRRSAISLAATLILGGVIIEIVVASAVLVYLVSSGGLGARLSEEAVLAAKSGVEDAVLRITRDKDFSRPNGYSFMVRDPSVSAEVIVNADTPQRTTVTSVGRAFTKRRKMVAVVERDQYGLVRVISFNEQPLP